MTATATLRPPSAPPPVSAPPKQRSRRWLRLVVPPGVVLLLVVVSLFAYVLQQPDQKNRGYLSPASTKGIGGERLAGLLRQRGITVEPQTRTSDALVSVMSGNATLFVPTPDLVHSYYLRMLKLLPASTRVVLVDPSDATLDNGRLPIGVFNRYLTAHAVAPDCGLPSARDAGTAAVGRSEFTDLDPDAGATELNRCYGGSLVEFTREQTTVTVVGAADPFRNDRIGEHHNQQLAVALLSQSPRVVWLDLHRREQQPGYVDDPALAGQPAAPPSLGPGSPDPDFPLKPTAPPPDGGDNGDPGDLGSGGSNPLWQAFPAWVFAAAALIALAFVMLALARARRLGTPIAEPLPVTVRAKETVEGRGRLYQRARARAPALRTLQGAARERLAHLLDLAPSVDRATLVRAVGVASGWAVEDVDQVLFSESNATPEARPSDAAAIDNDEALVAAAVRLEALMAAVTAAERRAQR